MMYLTAEHTVENLSFWFRCKRYNDLFQRLPSRDKETCVELIETVVPKGSAAPLRQATISFAPNAQSSTSAPPSPQVLLPVLPSIPPPTHDKDTSITQIQPIPTPPSTANSENVPSPMSSVVNIAVIAPWEAPETENEICIPSTHESDIRLADLDPSIPGKPTTPPFTKSPNTNQLIQ